MKKDRFLNLSLIFVWGPTIFRVARSCFKTIDNLLEGDIDIFDVIWTILSIPDQIPLDIVLAVCASFILVAIERLRCTLENNKDRVTPPPENEETNE